MSTRGLEKSRFIYTEYKRKKVGARLYSHLEENAKEKGYWTIQAQLFIENTASKSFFENKGFRKVGIREKIGKLDNEWIDNYLYEKTSTKNKILIDLCDPSGFSVLSSFPSFDFFSDSVL